MGATVIRGVLGVMIALALLTLIAVLIVAYVPGAEGLWTGVSNQIVDWAHQIKGGPPVTVQRR